MIDDEKDGNNANKQVVPVTQCFCSLNDFAAANNIIMIVVERYYNK